jgi:hypothetical protein
MAYVELQVLKDIVAASGGLCSQIGCFRLLLGTNAVSSSAVVLF